MNWIVKIIQGALIGAGGVLPGVSGGVLAVLFGVYKPLMRLLSNPLKNLKSCILELWPILIGYAIGWVGCAVGLGDLLEGPYRTQALAAFVGMTIGILPSLFREAGEQGRNRNSWISFGIGLVVAIGILYVADTAESMIVPNFGWNMFCGAALALSIIAPGMSSSVVLMPLKVETVEMVENVATPKVIDLYTHTMNAVKNLDIAALAAVVVGAVLTVVLLSRVIKWLMEKHYSVMFHAIVAIVIASTIFVFKGVLLGEVPQELVVDGVAVEAVAFGWVHVVCIVVGCIATLLLDKFNSKVEKPPMEE